MALYGAPSAYRNPYGESIGDGLYSTISLHHMMSLSSFWQGHIQGIATQTNGQVCYGIVQGSLQELQEKSLLWNLQGKSG